MGKDSIYCRPHPTDAAEVQCEHPAVLYAAALYWAICTITSIGYGDITATPGNTGEQAVASVLMVLGSLGWGFVIGTVVATLTNMSPESTHFMHTMGELNSMMHREGLSRAMRMRLREYFHQTKHVRQTRKRDELLELMSSHLMSEVTWEVNKAWLRKVWFLRQDTLPTAFLVHLSRRLQPFVYAPRESVPIGQLCIVHRGLVLYGGRVFSQGRVWGEDMILSTSLLQLKFVPRAMSFVEIFTLSREALVSVASFFPQAERSIRRAVVRLATRRAFIFVAEVRLRKRADYTRVSGLFAANGKQEEEAAEAVVSAWMKEEGDHMGSSYKGASTESFEADVKRRRNSLKSRVAPAALVSEISECHSSISSGASAAMEGKGESEGERERKGEGERKSEGGQGRTVEPMPSPLAFLTGMLGAAQPPTSTVAPSACVSQHRPSFAPLLDVKTNDGEQADQASLRSLVEALLAGQAELRDSLEGQLREMRESSNHAVQQLTSQVQSLRVCVEQIQAPQRQPDGTRALLA